MLQCRAILAHFLQLLQIVWYARFGAPIDHRLWYVATGPIDTVHHHFAALINFCLNFTYFIIGTFWRVDNGDKLLEAIDANFALFGWDELLFGFVRF